MSIIEMCRRLFLLLCFGLIAVLFCTVSVLPVAEAFQNGDRVMAVAKSQHMDARTGWNDMALQILPRFMIDESVVFHAQIPKFHVNATDYKINAKGDFKVILSFDYNQFSTPWITVYDAAQRRVLRRLKLTFTHDRYEILKVETELVYGNRIAYIDPTHPSLRGFEIHYHWENVEEEDFPAGLRALLISASLGFLVILVVVLMSVDYGDSPIGASSGSGKKTPSSSTSSKAQVKTSYR